MIQLNTLSTSENAYSMQKYCYNICNAKHVIQNNTIDEWKFYVDHKSGWKWMVSDEWFWKVCACISALHVFVKQKHTLSFYLNVMIAVLHHNESHWILVDKAHIRIDIISGFFILVLQFFFESIKMCILCHIGALIWTWKLQMNLVYSLKSNNKEIR